MCTYYLCRREYCDAARGRGRESNSWYIYWLSVLLHPSVISDECHIVCMVWVFEVGTTATCVLPALQDIEIHDRSNMGAARRLQARGGGRAEGRAEREVLQSVHVQDVLQVGVF
jgi:hypothetical protein